MAAIAASDLTKWNGKHLVRWIAIVLAIGLFCSSQTLAKKPDGAPGGDTPRPVAFVDSTDQLLTNNDGQLTREEPRPFVASWTAQEPPSGSIRVSPKARESEEEVIHGEPIESGHVILEWRVLSAPYRLGRRGREILLNGERIAVLPGGRVSGEWLHEDARHSDVYRSIADMEHWLYEGYVIIVFDERTRIVADCVEAADFLRLLIDADSLEECIALAAESCIDVSNSDGSNRIPTSQWRDILVGFRAADNLHAALEDWISEHAEEENADDDELVMRRTTPDRSAQRMYWLSVVGMVLVALSCGTLLTQRPEFGHRWLQLAESEASLRLVRWSLALIVALSIFDLGCTLLVTTKGGFLEINPVGKSLLHKPWMLSTFKLSATTVVVGILWSLRRHAGSQQASWWLCLILTLVTARWVAVQSLFFI